MRLANTPAERAAAHINDLAEHGTQTDPVVKTDALATSSIIFSALQAIGNDDGDEDMKRMKAIARKLSKNSLASWYKGAVLLVGDAKQIEALYGIRFRRANCFEDDGAPAADGKVPPGAMRPWLEELRRNYGNDWEGCMQAARMIEEYQSAKMRDEQWSRLPAVSAFERQDGNVRGWTSINSTSGNIIGIGAWGNDYRDMF